MEATHVRSRIRRGDPGVDRSEVRKVLRRAEKCNGAYHCDKQRRARRFCGVSVRANTAADV